MAEAAKIEEATMVLRPGMTEAEIDVVLARGRELKRAITYGKRRIEPLREHCERLRAELKLSLAALNDLQEGRMPKQMPKMKRVMSPEEKAKLRASWTPARRATQAETLAKVQAARAKAGRDGGRKAAAKSKA